MAAPYTTLAQLKPFFGNFVSNEPGDTPLADTVLEKKLLEAGEVIEAKWLYGKSRLPSAPSDPVTWLDLILEDLNLLLVLEKIIADRAITKHTLYASAAKGYEILSRTRLEDFELGRLTPAIMFVLKGGTIETTSFIPDEEIQEVARESSGLVINATSKPNLDTAKRICLRESAWVRAKAFNQYRALVIDDLSANKLSKFKGYTRNLVALQLQRIAKRGQNNPGADQIMNLRISEALNTLKDLQIGKLHKSLLG